MTSEQQPTKVHVDLAQHPLFTTTADLAWAYGQTTDRQEAMRLAWINAQARYFALGSPWLKGGSIL